MTNLETMLARVTRALDSEGVPYMVIGGFAVILHGEPRTTVDLDITVDVHQDGAAGLVRIVSGLGKATVDKPAAFAERTRVLPIVTHEGTPVDFILATLSFELKAIENARVIEIAGAKVRVCTPEDLIIHKIVSERPRDHEDVVGILRRQGPNLDIDALDRSIRTLADDLTEPAIHERFVSAQNAAGLSDHARETEAG